MSEKTKFPLHPSDTPVKAFDRAMRHRLYYYAAQIARDYGLGDKLVREAAFKAYCRFDDLGALEAKLIVLREFGITESVVVLTADGVLRAPDLGFPPLRSIRKEGATRPN